MRYLALAMMLVGGCGSTEILYKVPPCGVPCAIDENGYLIFDGAALAESCNPGTSVCDHSGDGSAIVTCPDFIPIGREVCDPDNKDEDCDGEPNNIVHDWYDYENTCNSVGECQYSIQTCQPDGTMVCEPLSLLYGPEVCDGEDNDCDGLVDGEDPDLTYSGDFRYNGPPETLNVGECRAGVLKCEGGVEYHWGEVLPTSEICGNGDDDDCDGLTDEDEDDSIAEAFLISIDFSGSMQGTIESVIEALCEWADTDVFVNSQFAIQAIAGNYEEAPYITNVTGFVSARTACQELEHYYVESNLSGGNEFVPYGIWGVNNDDDLRLQWPDELRRRVVFFSDEPPQGISLYGDPYDDLRMVAEDCAANNYSVGGFVSGDYSSWRLMTDPCMGWLETLTPDPSQMRSDLDYRFGTECGE